MSTGASPTFSNFPGGFANGLSVRGMPLMQMQPGQVFYLGNGPALIQGARGGSDGNRGTFLSPYATLQARSTPLPADRVTSLPTRAFRMVGVTSSSFSPVTERRLPPPRL